MTRPNGTLYNKTTREPPAPYPMRITAQFHTNNDDTLACHVICHQLAIMQACMRAYNTIIAY